MLWDSLFIDGRWNWGIEWSGFSRNWWLLHWTMVIDVTLQYFQGYWLLVEWRVKVWGEKSCKLNASVSWGNICWYRHFLVVLLAYYCLESLISVVLFLWTHIPDVQWRLVYCKSNKKPRKAQWFYLRFL